MKHQSHFGIERTSLARGPIAALAIAVVLVGSPARAVITRLTPLKDVLAAEKWIFVTRVSALDTKAPAVGLKVEEKLKGKPSFQSLAVPLTGDAEAIKQKHPELLLKRLGVGLPVVVFASPNRAGTKYTAVGYSNGTWFQMLGLIDKDHSDRVRWRFTHCEPYLRRTFKGTTAELRQVIRDGLDGKKAPPEPDPREPPGLGPEVGETVGAPQGGAKPQAAIGTSRRVLAVIPTVVLVGPLALLAALLPAVFAGLMIFVRRWRVFLGVASIESTIYFLHRWFHGSLEDSWFGRPTSLWLAMAVIALFGGMYCWTRQCGMERDQLKGARRVPIDAVILVAFALACAGYGATLFPRSEAAVEVVWQFGPPESGAILSTPLLHGDRVYAAATLGSGLTQNHGAVLALDANTGKELWRFDDHGDMKPVSISSPCFADGRLYVGEGFHQDSGCRLFCLDADTGKKLWEFRTGSHVESSPCVSEERVFFGAGEDGVYCLDALTGKRVWRFPGLHVDVSPLVTGHRLFAGSGYGSVFEVFCLDVTSGEPLWRKRVPWPVWGSPALAGDRVIFGLGNGDLASEPAGEEPHGALVCFDTTSGDPMWKCQLPNAVLGRPAVSADGKRVYCGCRDHNLYSIDAGQGTPCWKHDLGSPVIAAPVCVGGTVYAIGSDGRVACLRSDPGAPVWEFDVAKHTRQAATLFSSLAIRDERVCFGASLDPRGRSSPAVFCLQAKHE